MKAIYLNFNFKQSKFVAKGKIEFSNPNNPMRDKISKEGPKFQIFWKTATAATIGNYMVNLDLWTISSLKNRLFDNKPTC